MGGERGRGCQMADGRIRGQLSCTRSPIHVASLFLHPLSRIMLWYLL